MDKETYIYNHLKDFVKEAHDFTEKLEAITQWIYIEYQTNVYFCEIKGKRWSYITGRSNILYAAESYTINDNIGIVAEENNIGTENWNTLIPIIKRIISEEQLEG